MVLRTFGGCCQIKWKAEIQKQNQRFADCHWVDQKSIQITVPINTDVNCSGTHTSDCRWGASILQKRSSSMDNYDE